VGDPKRSVLVVALDDALSTEVVGGFEKSVAAWDLLWLARDAKHAHLGNTSEKEARLISFTFER